VTILTTPARSRDAAPDDQPRKLHIRPSGPDRIFNGVLGGSSAIVLLVLAAVVAFLCWKGFDAARTAGLGLFTDKSWDPDEHQFWIMPLLVGSIAIALIAVAIATPISIASALMINEYAPIRFKPVLTGVVDLLATVPSIVYGFWGLELVSNLQGGPARWLVDHVGFIPIFRTASPNQYVKSVFACGLVCAVTIIPIITSITREVMSQAPRDVCEAALGLGGTKWGMITDVIFPFSRNGILGAVLLGIGRGLGETMIVVLMLSSHNVVTDALLGPNGLGSIALQITENFVTGSVIAKSALILLGLILFLTTLAVNVIARMVVQRQSGFGT
jgi:phosphate transport system permease protein